MKRDNDPMVSIIRRLDIIIGLMLDSHSDQQAASSVTAKIYRLSNLGIANYEIANIIGKGNNYVNAVLGARKKRVKGDVNERE